MVKKLFENTHTVLSFDETSTNPLFENISTNIFFGNSGIDLLLENTSTIPYFTSSVTEQILFEGFGSIDLLWHDFDYF